MKLAFIGLGRMGSGMAANLLRAGHEVVVYNRTREKAQSLAEQGAHVADSVSDACRGREVVFTMLADDAALTQVVFGDDGIAASLPAGAIHVCSSTISTSMARKLTEEHSRQGQGYLSAPVFGRPEAAESAKVLVVAAGAEEPIQRCRPLFDTIGRRTFVAGAEPWQANAVKVCGNFMIASMLESFSEAFTTLRKSKVDPHLFLEVMNMLFGSPVYANYGKMIADQKFEPAGFALRLGLKDARLVLEAAQECEAPMPLASLIRDHMLAGVAQGQGEMDWCSVYRVIAAAAGLD